MAKFVISSRKVGRGRRFVASDGKGRYVSIGLEHGLAGRSRAAIINYVNRRTLRSARARDFGGYTYAMAHTIRVKDLPTFVEDLFMDIAMGRPRFLDADMANPFRTIVDRFAFAYPSQARTRR